MPLSHVAHTFANPQIRHQYTSGYTAPIHTTPGSLYAYGHTHINDNECQLYPQYYVHHAQSYGYNKHPRHNNF